jgi:hypothetical protein
MQLFRRHKPTLYVSLFLSVCWVSSSGVHAVSNEGHKIHGAMTVEKGYVRG